MNTIEEKTKAYNEVLEKAKEIVNDPNASSIWKGWLCNCFPELKESEDERIRGAIIDHLKDNNLTEWAAWLEKQKNYIKLPDSAYTSNRDVIEFADKYSHTVWENLMDKFKKNENYSIGCNDVSDIVLNAIINTYNWLKTKGEQKLIIPKFKVGDRVRYKGHVCDGVVTEITDTDYICGNAKLPISTQDKLELIEQKPTDKVKPKFKVGDWLVHNERKHVIKVVNPTPMVYEVVNILGYHHTITDTAIENNYHLWTIADAKDGDVLCDYIEGFDNPLIFILNKFERVNFGLANLSDYSSYCFLTASDRQRFEEGQYHHIHNIKPATKEQRDTLMKAMADAGYTFDFERKELKKIKPKPEENKGNIGGISSNWSVEDRSKVQRICKYLNEAKKYYADITEVRECIDWLHSLQDRLQPKQEWSEEDETGLTNTIIMLKEGASLHFNKKDITKAVVWLKSLRPQNKWKPSDDQMHCLKQAIDSYTFEPDYLEELYSELKKLRGE